MTTPDIKSHNNVNNHASLADEISLKDILLGVIEWYRYIKSKWIAILLVILIGALIGFIRANRQSLMYVATSTFVLQDGAGGGSQDGLASFLGIDAPAGAGIFQGDNLLELYRTRFMIKKTLLSKVPDRPNEYVIDDYLRINGFRQAWKDSVHLRNINFTIEYKDKKRARIQDSLISVFANDIRYNYLAVGKDSRLNILRVEVRSRNEDFSKLLNDQIVKTVNEYYVQTITRKSLNNVKLLKHQTDSIRAALNGAMYRVASSADITINANPARQVLRVPSQQNQVDAETNRTLLNELVRNLEVSKMALRRETPLIQILDEATFPLERRRESRTQAIITWALMAGVLAIAYYSVSLVFKKILE